MRIGIVSDSHGKVERLSAAMGLFASRAVGAIVHCGDVGNTPCVKVLGDSGAEVYLVPGNVDRHLEDLQQVARDSGIHFGEEVQVVGLEEGQFLIATHGHDERILGELIAGGQFPYVCHGHTHRVRDERIGSVRVINPGALSHPRRPRHPTVAILDTGTDTLNHIRLDA